MNSSEADVESPHSTVPSAAPWPRSLVPLVGLLVLGIGAFWYFARTPSELVFTNRLMAPVRLVVANQAQTVGAGATVNVRLPRGRTTAAEWELVRPLSANGDSMGVPVRGSVVSKGEGRIRAVAEGWGTNADYFAPLITNATSQSLRITVNADFAGAHDCRCAVRPGARRVFIGYYPLFENSTVEARAADGGDQRATFRQLGREVKAPDGSVGLSFSARDFQR